MELARYSGSLAAEPVDEKRQNKARRTEAPLQPSASFPGLSQTMLELSFSIVLSTFLDVSELKILRATCRFLKALVHKDIQRRVHSPTFEWKNTKTKPSNIDSNPLIVNSSFNMALYTETPWSEDYATEDGLVKQVMKYAKPDAFQGVVGSHGRPCYLSARLKDEALVEERIRTSSWSIGIHRHLEQLEGDSDHSVVPLQVSDYVLYSKGCARYWEVGKQKIDLKTSEMLFLICEDNSFDSIKKKLLQFALGNQDDKVAVRVILGHLWMLLVLYSSTADDKTSVSSQAPTAKFSRWFYHYHLNTYHDGYIFSKRECHQSLFFQNLLISNGSGQQRKDVELRIISTENVR